MRQRTSRLFLEQTGPAALGSGHSSSTDCDLGTPEMTRPGCGAICLGDLQILEAILPCRVTNRWVSGSRRVFLSLLATSQCCFGTGPRLATLPFWRLLMS